MNSLALAGYAEKVLTSQQLLEKYDGRAPRYTSYPTAVQFTPAIDANVHDQWLDALPAGAAVSIYLHVPFCQQLCWYCGCSTRAVHRRSTVSDYVDLLIQEIEQAAVHAPPGLISQTVHFGGGTPNILSDQDLARLILALQRRFGLVDAAELSIEMDPAVLSRDWVEAAARRGMTRASLGVQCLAPHVQAAVNRIEPFEVIERAVGWLRAVGVKSINFDLMYGLPLQTTADIRSTLAQVLTLRPERLALFGYAHVPWMRPHQKLIRDADLPGAAARLEQAQAAADVLSAAGYIQIGIDHFALPHDSLALAQAAGRLHRNFQGYVAEDAAAILGFGASSISCFPQGYVQNIAGEAEWRKAVKQGSAPVARGVALTDDDRMRAEIIERLMCDLSVDLFSIAQKHERSPFGLFESISNLAEFAADGLMTYDHGALRVTERGRPFVRSICSAFDAYLQAGATRHAQVV